MSKKMSPSGGRDSKTTVTLIALAAGALLLLLVGIGIWRGVSPSNQGAASATVGPQLAVVQERVDLGRQPFDKRVRAEFQVKNVGDLPLMLDASRPIKALEGC
jgi:hypothetical protein